MKILIGSYYSGGSGADKVKTFLANQWVQLGYDLTVLSMDDSRGYFPIDKRVTKVVIPHYRGINIYKDVLELRKFFKQNRYDVIITFADNFSIKVALSLLGINNEGQLIMSERNDPAAERKDKLNRMLRKWAFRKADLLVFQTPNAQKYFPEDIQKKSIVIPNPLNQNLPSWQKNIDTKKIVAVGRLEPQKNVPMLLKAFSIFLKSFPEYSLEICGEGSLKEEIIELISELHLNGSVKLLGFCDNIWEIMSSASMYVSSADYEGISNYMLEALGIGVPTIVTDCPAGGERMFIDGETNGLLVEVGDIKGMAQAMKRIAGDNDLALEISKNSIKIREILKPDLIGKKWLDEIQKCSK